VSLMVIFIVERIRKLFIGMCCNFQGGWLVDVKESRNGNPTGDLQMAADRTRHHPLCRPVVSSLFCFAT
jgi:hypothetical protein